VSDLIIYGRQHTRSLCLQLQLSCSLKFAALSPPDSRKQSLITRIISTDGGHITTDLAANTEELVLSRGKMGIEKGVKKPPP